MGARKLRGEEGEKSQPDCTGKTMRAFTQAEIEYLTTQPLVVGAAGGTAASKKFRDVRRRPEVAFVVDDLAAVDPWTPRRRDPRPGGGPLGRRRGGRERLSAPFQFDPAWIGIRPRRIRDWGIDTGSFDLSARDVA
jgi:pyridoxamine 5'-phosphate oxidase family protein